MGNTMKHFKDWLNATVPYEKFKSRDAAGELTFDASSGLSCYIDGRTVEVINDNKEEVTSNEQLYVDGEATQASGITLNDRFTVERPRVAQALRKFYDDDGNLDYLVVYL